MKLRRFFCVLIGLYILELFVVAGAGQDDYISAIGDPGMKRDDLRVAIEAWNQCNEVNKEIPGMGSPRMADCFDIDHSTFPRTWKTMHIIHRFSLKIDTYINFSKVSSEFRYFYLLVQDDPRPWQFWMIMLKSGNMDTTAAICPENGKKSVPFPPEPRFPCFGEGCMNMPLIDHEYTHVEGQNNSTLKGSFHGTWDLNANDNGTSSFNVTWVKEIGKGSWVFHHFLQTSSNYPWLMLYLRSDATSGFSGGYHYQTRGMSKIVPKSPDFKVRFRLEVKQGGGNHSQFYLMDMGGCWKNNGKPCDGDVTTDVTRYSEMIINPETEAWCKPNDLKLCPPYHTFPNGTKVHRTDRDNYPYDAYHLWCAPGNAMFLEQPYSACDAYSNPQPQEILQILPHPAWGEYGYPTNKGQGWVGDPRSWELDVGRLSQSLYFYQVHT
ncbi:conserved hypothetical protein [Ricinus communis]|uniref:DUF7705 domain-containing protein n=1 Tax=Ricinus communis TaxID=3988 RepID=B9SR57_RICCO|nr:conserved hypothetical protein [Ricinus communis]